MEVILYKTPTCTQCKVLKDKMDKKKIKYTEISDIDVLTSMGIKSVPQLDVDGVRYSSLKEANKWVNAQEVQNG